jgi:hypothetical protein
MGSCMYYKSKLKESLRDWKELLHDLQQQQQQQQLRDFGPQANYTDRATPACRS